MAADVKTRPPAVTIGPPRLIEPVCSFGTRVPSGTSQTFLPVKRSTASVVPHGHEHLVRPVFPVVSQPVIAVVRHGAGPAETALLELLRQESWSGSASFSPVS